MSIICLCSKCSTKFKVDAQYAGRRARCPSCATIVAVPNPGGQAPAAPKPQQQHPQQPQPNQSQPKKQPKQPRRAQPLPPDSPGPEVVNLADTVKPSDTAGDISPLQIDTGKPATTVVETRADKPPTVVEPGPAKDIESDTASASNAPAFPEVNVGGVEASPETAAPANETSAENDNPFANLGLATDSGAGAGPNIDVTASPTGQSGSGGAGLGAITASNSGGMSASRGRSGGPKRAAAKSNQLVMVGGIAVVALAAIGLIGFLLTGVLGKSTKKPGTVHLVWPAMDRKGATAIVDGKTQEVPESGDVTFELTPGPHKILLKRRGFEPLNLPVDVESGDNQELNLAWVELAGIDVPGPQGGFTNPNEAQNLDPVIPGFEGWRQDFIKAQSLSERSGQPILLFFGMSDRDPTTQQMTTQVFANDRFKAEVQAKFHTVVIDVPTTEEGYGRLLDSAQNTHLLRRYNIRPEQIPVQMFVDAQGVPYAFDTSPPTDITSYLRRVETLQANRQKRTELFEATKQGDPTSRLQAASAALKWLGEQKLTPFYRSETSGWLTLARQADSDNSKGLFEQFFAADWMARIAAADDSQQVERLVTELVSWTNARKFSRPDLAVGMFLFGAFKLSQQNNIDAAGKLIGLGERYAANDAGLLRRLQAAKRALAGANILSNGTGFVIAPGYVLTNHHVIEGEGRVMVRLGDENDVPGEVVASDANRDIALVKVDAANHPWQPLTIVEASKRGAQVAAFGYPLMNRVGTGLKLSPGVISGLPDSSSNDMLVLTCLINPGNSGGPLCNNRGQVIGMVTAKSVSASSKEDSYGLAVPAEALVDFLDKNLPAVNPGTVSGPTLEWSDVDEKVSKSVLLILKVGRRGN